MFFDALTRRFSKLPSLKNNANFSVLAEEVSAQIDSLKDQTQFLRSGNFKDSKWFAVKREPRLRQSTRLSRRGQAALNEVCKLIEALCAPGQRVVFIQIAWMEAGERVHKHLDQQRRFGFTRRFNICLVSTPTSAISVYNNVTEEHPIRLESGDIFELNNRSWHSAVNMGPGRGIFLIVDFAPSSCPAITEDDRTPDLDECNVNLPIVVWEP